MAKFCEKKYVLLIRVNRSCLAMGYFPYYLLQCRATRRFLSMLLYKTPAILGVHGLMIRVATFRINIVDLEKANKSFPLL